MATLNGYTGTLLDIAKRIGAEQPEFIRALTKEQHGTGFAALPFKPISGWSDPFMRQTARPTVTWRHVGQEISAYKSDRDPMSESLFLLSGYSKVDRILADSDPRGPRTYRQEEDSDYLESMGYELSYGLFYASGGNDDAQPDGLMKRLPTGGTCTFNAGATDETISIYAFRMGFKQFHGIYNPNITGGKIIEARDYGATIVEDASKDGNELYRTFFNVAIGFAQKHPRSIGRIYKINSANTPTADDFFSLFSKMEGKPDLLITTWVGAGYVGALKSTALIMTPNDNRYDVMVDNVMGIPLAIDVALVDDESAITV